MRATLLNLLRIREQPDPPPGADASLKTFRASRKHLRYNTLLWLPKQVAGLLGLLFSLAFFGILSFNFGPFNRGEQVLQHVGDRVGNRLGDRIGGLLSGDWNLGTIFFAVEMFAIAAYLTQLILSGLLLKLDWELRWYMVSDEFLRLREGLWSVREQTIRIANIQNMKVNQGPLQRLFGIADLEVHTAGGGNLPSDLKELEGKIVHVGHFRGLEDARELRDRIRERLRRERGAGLGDADDETLHDEPFPEIAGTISEVAASSEPVEVTATATPQLPGAMVEDLVQAARDLRDETRTLRRAIGAS